MIYIGIDPGKNGGLAILNGEEVQTFRYDRDTYRCVLPDLRGEEAMCCLEHVSAMPGQGVTSMFHFGEGFGWLQGMLEAYEIPYELVRPQKWKKAPVEVKKPKREKTAVRNVYPARTAAEFFRFSKAHGYSVCADRKDCDMSFCKYEKELIK